MAFTRIMWFRIVDALRDYLKNFTYKDGRPLFGYLYNRENLKIRTGTVNAGEYPAINILFGDESAMNDRPYNHEGGKIQIWVDLYVGGEYNGDEDVSSTLYEHLFKMEEEIFRIIDGFNRVVRDSLDIATNLKVSGILSDGDNNLPVSAMNRIVIDIEWRKA